jgi:hypothetical protein
MFKFNILKQTGDAGRASPPALRSSQNGKICRVKRLALHALDRHL